MELVAIPSTQLTLSIQTSCYSIYLWQVLGISWACCWSRDVFVLLVPGRSRAGLAPSLKVFGQPADHSINQACTKMSRRWFLS